MDNLKEHNKEVIRSAEYRANEMKSWPSPLEERMKTFLDIKRVPYESQKIFYIRNNDGWISRYYIADFYLPKTRTIVEVDGKFHDKHKQKDRDRTKEIQKHYPGVEVVRFKFKDVYDTSVLKKFLHDVHEL